MSLCMVASHIWAIDFMCSIQAHDRSRLHVEREEMIMLTTTSIVAMGIIAITLKATGAQSRKRRVTIRVFEGRWNIGVIASCRVMCVLRINCRSSLGSDECGEGYEADNNSNIRKTNEAIIITTNHHLPLMSRLPLHHNHQTLTGRLHIVHYKHMLFVCVEHKCIT